MYWFNFGIKVYSVVIQLRERVGLNSSLLPSSSFSQCTEKQWKTRDSEKRKVRVRKSLVFATILLLLLTARWKFCFSCHSSLLLVLMHICIIIIDFIGRCLKSSIGKLSRQGFFFCCSSSIFYGNVCRHLVVHLVLKYVCRVVQFWLLLKRVACITNCKISFPKVMDALLFTFHRKLFLFS